MGNKRRLALIIVMSVVVSAVAVFAAVGEVLRRFNVSNNTEVSATTYSGNGSGLNGTSIQCNKTENVTLNAGTYMIIFWGQNAAGDGKGAVCYGFYKANSATTWTANIGTGGGSGANNRGGGMTKVQTNFGRPSGSENETTAIASGAGAGCRVGFEQQPCFWQKFENEYDSNLDMIDDQMWGVAREYGVRKLFQDGAFLGFNYDNKL